MNEHQHRHLLHRAEVLNLLQLPGEDVQWLIDTNQLPALRFRGHERFDSIDVFELVDTYKQLSKRKNQPRDEYDQ